MIQLFTSPGGQRTHTVFSGTAGGDANIYAGAGRLDVGFQFGAAVLALSGKSITFYDSAVAVSGGPLATSGHKVIGVLGSPSQAASGDMSTPGAVTQFGVRFTSGLCYASTSGQVGFTASYSPE
jgi:hypothetical protein